MKISTLSRFILFVFSMALIVFGSAYGQEKNNDMIISKIENILIENAGYEYDKSVTWQHELLDLMKDVYVNEELKTKTEKLMIEFLQSDATIAAKKAIGLDFANIVTTKSVSVLLKMLQKEETEELAMLIIHKSDLDVSKKLISLMPKVSEKARIGIINHFGVKRDEVAVDILYKSTQDRNIVVSTASLMALGNIGTAKSASLLLKATSELTRPLDKEVYDALLISGSRSAKSGNTDLAETIYKYLLSSKDPINIRGAALKGMFSISNDQVGFIKENLKIAEEELKPDIIRSVMNLPDTYKQGNELLRIDGLTNENRIQLIIILANRKDPSIHDTAIEFMKSEDILLRSNALKVFAKIAFPTDVKLLTELAANYRSPQKELAQSNLYTMPGKEVDKAMINILGTASSEVKVEIIKALGQRNNTSVSEVLLMLAKDEDTKVRIEAIKVLGKTGDYNYLPEVIKILFASTSTDDREELEKTLYQMAIRYQGEQAQTAMFSKMLKEVNDEPNISSLLVVLGKIGNPGDYKLIMGYYSNNNKAIQSSAIRAISEWPNSEPLEDLFAIIKNSNDPRIGTLALRGYLRILETDLQMAEPQKIKKINEVFQMAGSETDKKMIISAIGKVRDLESLQVLVKMMGKPEFKPEIEAAIRGLTPLLYSRNQEEVEKELQKARELTDNEDFKKYIEDGLSRKQFGR